MTAARHQTSIQCGNPSLILCVWFTSVKKNSMLGPCCIPKALFLCLRRDTWKNTPVLTWPRTHTYAHRQTQAATCTQMSTGKHIYTNAPINLSAHLSIFSGVAHVGESLPDLKCTEEVESILIAGFTSYTGYFLS